MATFVLIHGAWHGGWCWTKVVPLLERAGHHVAAPDLPGHGSDQTPTSDVTLQAYADRVAAVLDAQTEPVVLVGHSMGGAVISQAAELRPEKIRTLVYLTAFLMPDGESLSSLAAVNAASLVGSAVRRSEDGTSSTCAPDQLKRVFYNDCSDEDVAYAQERLVPQAAAPITTPIHISEARFGRVPRVYIECLQDNALIPAAQQHFYTGMPCARVISMDTSHSPFFSAPEDLARHLLSLL